MGADHSQNAQHILQWALISYNDLCNSIDEMNKLTSRFKDVNGRSLLFKIKNGTDQHPFLWRGLIRIQTLKVTGSSTSGCVGVTSKKLLSLRQYLGLRHAILNQMVNISATTTSATTTTGTTTTTSATSSKTTLSPPSFTNQLDLDVSVLMSDFGVDDGGDGKEELCCICMERGVDVLLPCAHEYCLPCIEQWRCSSNTCPECRRTMRLDDSLVVLEKPEDSEIEEQLASSLTTIPDTR